MKPFLLGYTILNSCLCCPLGPGFGAVLGLGAGFGFGLGSGMLKCLGLEFSSKLKKKIFVYVFSSLCHRCKRGGDQCLVPLASLWWLWSSHWPPFAIFLWFYTIFIVVLNICFPCLSFFTHTSTQQQTRRKRATATLETMRFETEACFKIFQHHILHVAVNEADERGVHWIATYHWVQMWH